MGLKLFNPLQCQSRAVNKKICEPGLVSIGANAPLLIPSFIPAMHQGFLPSRFAGIPASYWSLSLSIEIRKNNEKETIPEHRVKDLK